MESGLKAKLSDIGSISSAISLLFVCGHRWIFVCCGSRVEVYSYTSHDIVYTLSYHSAAVTGIAVNPRNKMQVKVITIKFRPSSCLYVCLPSCLVLRWTAASLCGTTLTALYSRCVCVCTLFGFICDFGI